jgi:hypothetical protein
MKTTLNGNTLIVDREGEKFYTESAWWYALKIHLNDQGYDLIKKVMSKDGHMVGGDTYPYYLRDRKKRYCFYLRDRKKRYCFYDGDYCLRFVYKPNVVYLIYQDWRLK